jgi:LysR family transcriptional regulator for metE and metH
LPAFSTRPYAADFVSIMRETSLLNLPQIELL